MSVLKKLFEKDKNLIKYIIIVCLIGVVFIVTLNILFYINDKQADEERRIIENIFAEYKKSSDFALIDSGSVFFDEDVISFDNYYISDNRIIVVGNVAYLADNSNSNSISFYKRSLDDDNKTLMFIKSDLPSYTTIQASDSKFYISYEENKKNIIDVYDVIENKYYNFLEDCSEDISDIILKEQIDKYHYEMKLVDYIFYIRNVDTDEIEIIDDNFILTSSFGQEMSQVKFWARKIYMSYGHILLTYVLVINGRYSSIITFEYLFSEHKIEFVCLDRFYNLDKKYVFVGIS